MNYVQKSLTTLICICLGAAVMVDDGGQRSLAKDSTLQTNDSDDVREALLPHTTPGTGTATPRKLCSAVHSLNLDWRDTVAVSDDWNAETCKTFARSLGLTQYQLGCANPNSFSWGDRNGSPPGDNRCGW